MQGNMKKERKSRAFNPRYESPFQGTLSGFEHPFERELDPSNRWVVLSHLIPWDEICGVYYKQVGKASTGREPLNPRIVPGSLIIKYLCHLDDREVMAQIPENIYMQYFLGYSSFISEKPFDASLLVEIRKRIGMDVVNSINERIVELKTHFESKEASEPEGNVPPGDDSTPPPNTEEVDLPEPPFNKGKVIFDATACPQDIAYPTDLDLLSDARHKSEELIDILYDPLLHGTPKPRTYRQTARREYLGTAQKRKKTKKQIRSALRKQLGYLGRNIRTLNFLLDAYETIPLRKKELKYFYVIQTLYEQQLVMYRTKTHRVDDRIVSIHQPHVRPIVRGKSKADVEFGAKIHLSLIDGISFLDELSWDEDVLKGRHLFLIRPRI
jgi:hypothetical protein